MSGRASTAGAQPPVGAQAMGSQSALRLANRSHVVHTIKQFGGLTQVELAEATGLSAASISTIVRELLAAGVVDTATTTRSGRRAQMVTLARRMGLAAGVLVGQRHLRMVLGDFTHEVVATHSLPLPHEHRADTTLDRVALLLVDMVERVGSSLDEMVGIGLGVPAPVEESTGMISVNGLMPGWEGVHVGQVLAKRLGRPVHVDNDANLGALAEATLGAARDYADSIFIRASHGTGAGIVINGRLHRGFAGTAGEIGHVQVDPQGPVCRCGSRGCLDAVVGGNALLEPLRTSHGALTLRDVVSRTLAGDRGCAHVVADAGATIGRVAAGLGAAFNPQCIVVGGELAETGEVLLGPLRDEVRRRVLHNRIAPLEVVPAALGQQAEVMGALVHALQSTTVPLTFEENELPASSQEGGEAR